LDLKLWAADVNYSTRKSIFKSLNEKLKVLMRKTEECHKGSKVRKNLTWMESFHEWVEYGKFNPDRKNRIPLDESKLSSWVHEQRKAFKANKLAED